MDRWNIHYNVVSIDIQIFDASKTIIFNPSPRIVTLIVTVFIMWGTALDIVITRRTKRKMLLKKYSKDCSSSESSGSGLNCTTYDLTRATADKKNCVGIGIPSGVNNNNSDENLAIDLVEEEKKLGKDCTWFCQWRQLIFCLFQESGLNSYCHSQSSQTLKQFVIVMLEQTVFHQSTD